MGTLSRLPKGHSYTFLVSYKNFEFSGLIIVHLNDRKSASSASQMNTRPAGFSLPLFGACRSFHLQQPFGLKIRLVDAGYLASKSRGRIGRFVKLPPQLGQTPFSLFSTQSMQKVHSNVQIMASSLSGARSLSQHSQFGRSSSIGSVLSEQAASGPICCI